MHYCMMTNRNIVTNRCCVFLKGAMNTGPVLYVDFVAHADKVHITSYNGIEPDAAIITHHRSIRSNKTIVAKLRVFIFYRKYNRYGIINN